MPRVELTVTDITRDPGVEQPAQEAGDPVDLNFIAENAGDVILEIENATPSDQTVEILPNPQMSADGLPVGNLVLEIPTGETHLFGPFRQSTFKQNPAGMLHINPTSDVLFRCYRIARPSQT